MTESTEPSREILWPWWPRALALSVLAVATWVVITYAGQPVVEINHFRQTETASTTYWMIREGWKLAYETPVWGYPWSVPIEFPIYQALVASIVWSTGLPLEPTGRLVSFAFLVAIVWPAFMIARRLGAPRDAAWVFCALLWSSPLHLIWARMFMIETAALFFALAAVPYLLDLRAPDASWRSAVLAAVWGTLGVLQWPIAAAPMMLILAAVALLSIVRSPGSIAVRTGRLARLALATGVPFFVGLAWTQYADIVKAENFVGRTMLLDFRMSKYYVGTFAQRFELDGLREIFWKRLLVLNAGGALGAALVTGALVFGRRSLRGLVAVCLLLTAFPVMLFFSVSLFLDYYQLSSAVFLVAAVTIACVSWLPTIVKWRGIVPLAVSALVVFNLYVFWSWYGSTVRWAPDATNFNAMTIGDVLRRYTPEESGMIVFGTDWEICPAIAYLSERKAFTLPDYNEELVGEDPASYLGGRPLGAMVFCATENRERYNGFIRRYSAEMGGGGVFHVSDCYVWLPHTSAITLPDGTTALPTPFID
ncbi:MAG: hypothetical protein AB7Q29_16375 [Vicinamibacterales bacterium]